MKPAVYIETTIVSYLTALRSRDIVRQAHELITQHWWDEASSLFQLVTSDFVVKEASLGDPIASTNCFGDAIGT